MGVTVLRDFTAAETETLEKAVLRHAYNVERWLPQGSTFFTHLQVAWNFVLGLVHPANVQFKLCDRKASEKS